MALKAFFQQNTAYNAADLRALIDAIGPMEVGADGRVTNGLTVTYASNQLRIAKGHGIARATAASTGYNFAVVNTADNHAAQNVSGGSTTWAPESSATPRTDIVYLQVDDIALDGAGSDVTTAYYALGTTSLPSESCILLARVTSSNNSATITDYRLLPPVPLGWLGEDTDTDRESSPTTPVTFGCDATVTVARNRKLKITGLALGHATAGPGGSDWTGEIQIYRGTQSLGEVARMWIPSGGGRAIETLHGFVTDTPSPGTYTYSLRAGATQAGIFDIRGDLMPTRILVEDIGEA